LQKTTPPGFGQAHSQKKRRGVAAKTDPDLFRGGFLRTGPRIFFVPAPLISGVVFAFIMSFDLSKKKDDAPGRHSLSACRAPSD
jgi:hypothetical protein